MNRTETRDVPIDDGRLAQATDWFLRVRSESARAEDLPQFEQWLAADARNALAYQQIVATWEAVGAQAAAPEIMVRRRDALQSAQRVARSRWSAQRRFPTRAALAASLLLAILGGLSWFYWPRGVHSTDLGERRVLTLPDNSIVALDARSRIRVDYRQNERLISLERGQARFDVARDPTRPFRVRAGGQTVVALGTQFNVELVGGNVLVTLIEGHVAVTGIESASVVPPRAPEQTAVAEVERDGNSPRHANGDSAEKVSTVELSAGQGLRVLQNGQAAMLANVNIERATAWESGKLFFDNEPLASAVERVNRYSRDRIDVDPPIANLRVSGVFNSGHTAAFIEAVTEYFPVQVQRTGTSEIRLVARKQP